MLSLYIEKHQSYNGFVNYQLCHIDDIIEALNLKTNDILKNTSNNIMLPNLSFLQWKTPKL